MSNSQSPFTIIMNQDSDNPRTFHFSLLENGNPINPVLYVYVWDLGDGNSSNVASPTHTYQTSGSFEVKCEVESAIDPKPEDDEAGTTSGPAIPPVIVVI